VSIIGFLFTKTLGSSGRLQRRECLLPQFCHRHFAPRAHWRHDGACFKPRSACLDPHDPILHTPFKRSTGKQHQKGPSKPILSTNIPKRN